MKFFDSKLYRLLEFYSYQVVVAGLSIRLFDAIIEIDWVVIAISVVGILVSCEILRAKTKRSHKED